MTLYVLDKTSIQPGYGADVVILTACPETVYVITEDTEGYTEFTEVPAILSTLNTNARQISAKRATNGQKMILAETRQCLEF
jgi:hypothetical protein